MKKQHLFRITVEHVQTLCEVEPLESPLVFEAGDHDNIIDLARRVAERGTYSAEDAAALMVGLKLFGELVLTRKDDAMLQAMKEPIGRFIGQLKSRRSGDADSLGVRMGEIQPLILAGKSEEQTGTR